MINFFDSIITLMSGETKEAKENFVGQQNL